MEARELLEEAKRLFIQGKPRESIDAFTRAIDKGADPFMSYLSRGAAYLKEEDTGRAIEDFTKAIEADRENFRPYYYRAMAHMKKEDYKSAVADFSSAIKLNPDHGASFFARGTCLTQLGMDEEAARDITTAIRYSEASIQGFLDTYGIIRTQFDSVMALISGERRHPGMELTEEETEKLKKWLEEGKEE